MFNLPRDFERVNYYSPDNLFHSMAYVYATLNLTSYADPSGQTHAKKVCSSRFWGTTDYSLGAVYWDDQDTRWVLTRDDFQEPQPDWTQGSGGGTLPPEHDVYRYFEQMFSQRASKTHPEIEDIQMETLEIRIPTPQEYLLEKVKHQQEEIRQLQEHISSLETEIRLLQAP